MYAYSDSSSNLLKNWTNNNVRTMALEAQVLTTHNILNGNTPPGSWDILKSLQKQLQRWYGQQCPKIYLRIDFSPDSLQLSVSSGINSVRASFLVYQVPCTSARVVWFLVYVIFPLSMNV